MDIAQHVNPALLAVAAGVSNFMGGLAITSRKSWNKTALSSCLAIGAGFILALSVIKLIPLSFEYSPRAALFMLAGYFLVHFAEHGVSPHFHFGEEVHVEALVHPSAGWAAFAGLAIHSLLDGITMASGFAIDFSLGLIIFVALLLHKIPEGFTIATVFLASGRSRRVALLAAGLLGVFTIVGYSLLFGLKQHIAVFLPLSAGATLYVAASDLIPAVNEERGLRMSFCVLVGICLFYAADRIAAGF